MSTRKVVVIGWDAATFTALDPLLQAGALPNLARLIEQGRSGTLRSTLHPLSPTAWSSFMTGMNPGKHGIYDFVSLRDRGEFTLTHGSHVAQSPIWARLSRAGKRVAVLNVPMTYPPARVNGYLIAGMDTPAHARDYTYPPELLAQLEARFGPYTVDVRARGWPWQSVEAFTQEYVRKLCASVRQQGEVVAHLATQEKLDFVTAVFTATDRVQHALGHLLAGEIRPDDGIGQVYRACDAATGQILAALGEGWTILLMSDHGASAYDRVFRLNSWLEQQGLLQLAPAPRQSRLDYWWGPVRRRLARLVGAGAVGEEDGAQQLMQRIVWPESKAFALGAFGSIYLATAERFPYGSITDPAEVEKLCRHISTELLAAHDPETGQPIVAAVHRGRDLYAGPFSHFAPDLLLETHEDYFVRLAEPGGAQVAGKAGRYATRSLLHTGKHTPDGILVAAGEPVAPAAARLQGAHIMDLAPTILYLNGLPVPESMDGRPLLDWLDPATVAAQPLQQVPEPLQGEENNAAYNAQDAGKVAEHLRNLGYLN
jgi:predicted AlkP superfamily phosphohydrolase/phosphomutase